MNDVFTIFAALGFMALLGFIVGAASMAWLALFIPVSTWRRLRTKLRPTLWAWGLDWPEIRRTFKRAFLIYYARGLPEFMQPGSPSSSLDDDSLDESGDVPPGDSQSKSSPTG